MVNDLTVTGARTAKVNVWRARLGGASQHRPLARQRRRLTGTGFGHVAQGRRLAVPAPLGALPVQRRPEISAAHLPGLKGAARILPRHARQRNPSTNGWSPIRRCRRRTAIPGGIGGLPPGRPWTCKFCATCSPTPSRPRRRWVWTKTSQKQLAATRARLAPNQIGKRRPAPGMAGGLGHAGAANSITAMSRIFTACFRAATSRCAARRNWRPR